MYDLAKRMIQLQGMEAITSDTPQSADSNSIVIDITGLRPGEKLYEELLIEQESHSTAHPLIFTAIERSISMAEMMQLLDTLQQACDKNDNPQIRQILADAPIDFIPTTSATS